MTLSRVLTPLLVALVAVLLWRSCFSVDQDEVALRTRFGQIEGQPYAPGLHLKSPLDEVFRFDRRILTRSYPGESFLTRDQKALNVDFYIKWRLLDVRRYFLATHGGDEDIVALRLADSVRDRVKAVVAGAPLVTVSAEPRGSLGNAGFNAVSAAAEQFGVQLIDVELQRVELTEDVANSVYQRMQQSMVAEAQRLRADGGAAAERIRADADRKRADTLADASRDAQHIRGDADARATATYARAYSHNAEFAAFYRSLQAYKNVFGRDGDILVISPEGEFFKYLHSASGR
jgi:membrane protease subunit HflC